MVWVGSWIDCRDSDIILMMWHWPRQWFTWLEPTWTCLCGCWRGVMMSSNDIKWHQQVFFDALLELECMPVHGGKARNPSSACRRVWERFTVGFLEFCRSAGHESDSVAHVRRSRSHCMRVVACAAVNGGRVFGLWSWEAVEHVWVGKSRFAWLLDFDIALRHGGC